MRKSTFLYYTFFNDFFLKSYFILLQNNDDNIINQMLKKLDECLIIDIINYFSAILRKVNF